LGRLQVGGDVAEELNLMRTHLKNVAVTDRPATNEDCRLPHLEEGGSRFENLLDTARAITVNDQVITVDTAVAHLSGVMGRPTIILFPDPPDWRWGLKSQTSIFILIKT
jgi:ADP-heptose:LPS heptosyltransferase